MVGLEGQHESSGPQLAAVPKGTVVLLGQEFHAGLDWWKWALHEQYIWWTVCLYIHLVFLTRNGIRNDIGYRMRL